MKKFFCLFLIAAGSLAGSVGAQPLRFTLDDCLSYAAGNSYVREQMMLSHRAAELDMEQSRLERLPSLNASASENLSHQTGHRRTLGGSYGLSAGITLWQGGAVNEGVKQSTLAAEQAGVRVEQYDNTLAMNIMASYFAVVGYFELLDYQDALVKAGEEQVREGKARFEQQEILESDYLLLEAQNTQNIRNAAQTRQNIYDEQMNLRVLMSMELDTELELVAPDSTMMPMPVREEFMERAEAASPDRELLDYGVKLAESNLKIAKAGYYPSLSLSGGMSTGHSDDFNNWTSQLENRFGQSAGLSLSIPIFNRNRTRTSVARSKIALQQAELDRLQGQLDVRQSLSLGYSGAETALEDYRSLEIRENAYRKSLEVYRALYEAETITTVDLLQQENNYINVVYQFVQSKYGYMLRRRMLDIYMKAGL